MYLVDVVFVDDGIKPVIEIRQKLHNLDTQYRHIEMTTQSPTLCGIL